MRRSLVETFPDAALLICVLVPVFLYSIVCLYAGVLLELPPPRTLIDHCPRGEGQGRGRRFTIIHGR